MQTQVWVRVRLQTHGLHAGCLAAKGCLQPAPWSLDATAWTVDVSVAQGRRCEELFSFFPDGIVLGLWNTRSRQCFLAPAEDRIVTADDALIIMRDTSAARGDYAATEEPAEVDIGAPASAGV